jgi:hypothetical protein
MRINETIDSVSDGILPWYRCAAIDVGLARRTFIMVVAWMLLAALPAFGETTGFMTHRAETENGATERDSTLPAPRRFGVEMELGNLALARQWLAQGLSPDFMADHIGSGLMIGAWTGNVPLMTLFWQHGANVRLENEAGEDALLLAVWKGHRAAAEWLLQHGASLNRPVGKWSALHYAAFSGNKDLLVWLLQAGADINARNPNGATPLMMAIYDGHTETAGILLDSGANKYLRNDWGDGAMEWAMRYNQMSIARRVGNPEEFAAAANQPRENWGRDDRSEQVPPELDKLLRDRRYLIARGIPPAALDRNIAALRARYARQARAAAGSSAPRHLPVLEITADTKNPRQQTSDVRLEQRPAASPAYRLPRAAPNKVPARQ